MTIIMTIQNPHHIVNKEMDCCIYFLKYGEKEKSKSKKRPGQIRAYRINHKELFISGTKTASRMPNNAKKRIASETEYLNCFKDLLKCLTIAEKILLTAKRVN